MGFGQGLIILPPIFDGDGQRPTDEAPVQGEARRNHHLWRPWSFGGLDN